VVRPCPNAISNRRYLKMFLLWKTSIELPRRWSWLKRWSMQISTPQLKKKIASTKGMHISSYKHSRSNNYSLAILNEEMHGWS
jgi:hypothetical protein